MTYFHMATCHTIIGAKRFHFRVRDGIGWFTLAMFTKQTGLNGLLCPFVIRRFLRRLEIRRPQGFWSLTLAFSHFLVFRSYTMAFNCFTHRAISQPAQPRFPVRLFRGRSSYASPVATPKRIGCYMVKPHGQLVHVSFTHYCASTPCLSTS